MVIRNVATAPVLLIDDAGPGFSTTGAWNTWTGGGYGSDHTTSGTAGSATPTAEATWTFTNLEPGQYRVWTTWVQAGNRATNAPYTLLDGTTARGTTRVNQQQSPASAAPGDVSYFGGFEWRRLSDVTVNSGTLAVRLANDADGYAVADTVRIERLTSDPAIDLASRQGGLLVHERGRALPAGQRR